jgi:hypothetical protein
MSKYRLIRGRDELVVVNEHRDFRVGSIRYEVRDNDAERIAVAASLSEAVAALTAQLVANPPRWQRDRSDRFIKITLEYCDFLVVEQGENGRWVAFRNDYALVDENGPKMFETAQEARRAADLHSDDGRPTAKSRDDGLRFGPSDPGEEDRLVPEHRLGQIAAEAAEGIAGAKAEHSKGCIRLDTATTIKSLIASLREIQEDSEFGSYDAQTGEHLPYFVLMEGAKASRLCFDEAAYHYGKLALRERLGPEVTDAALEQMIADVLRRLPGPDRLPKAA